MRTALTNPFSPGSDTVPDVWAGRTEHLGDWRDVVRPRRLAGLPERGRTILGEPGLGKSALVRRIAAEASRAGDWVTPQLRIPAGSDPLKLVARAVLDLAGQAGLPAARESRIAEALARVEAVAVSGLSLTLRGAEGAEPFSALTDLLVEVGRAALEDGRRVALIHVDEVQNITNDKALSQLLIALGDALTYETEVAVPGGARVRRSLPLAVYLTGLPDFEDMAGTRKGATFARRFKTSTLSAIDVDALSEALQEFVLRGWEVAGEDGPGRVWMEPEAAALIAEVCRGEPFLFQLAGEQAWYAGSSSTVTEDDVRRGWRNAEREATAHVERVLKRLPGRERQLLEVMAGLPAADRSLTRIAEAMGFTRVSEAGPTAQRLDTVRGIIDRGRPYTFRHRAVEAYLTSDWPRL